jgi:hypothetical protein
LEDQITIRAKKGVAPRQTGETGAGFLSAWNSRRRLQNASEKQSQKE